MKDLWKFRYSTSDVLAIEPGLTSMDIRNHRRRGLLATDRSTEKIGKERVLSLLTVYEIVLLTVMQNYGWSLALAADTFRYRLIRARFVPKRHKVGSKGWRRGWQRAWEAGAWDHPDLGPATIRALTEFDHVDTTDPLCWCILSVLGRIDGSKIPPEPVVTWVEVRRRQDVGSAFDGHLEFYHVLNVTEVIARADSVLTERLIERGEIDP